MKYIIFFFACMLTTSAIAFTNLNKADSTVTVKLINHTAETLTYVGATKTQFGNTFSVHPIQIPAGGTTIITGTTTPFYDLIGELHFKDSLNNHSILKIMDYRQIRAEHSVFTLRETNYLSVIKSKITNKNNNPRALSYIAVTLVIESTLNKDHPTAQKS